MQAMQSYQSVFKPKVRGVCKLGRFRPLAIAAISGTTTADAKEHAPPQRLLLGATGGRINIEPSTARPLSMTLNQAAFPGSRQIHINIPLT